MRPLISIGRFAALTGLSVRALRLYEQEGLLRPAVVDAQTGYRFYRWHQRAVAERIRTLRDLDLPLELVRAVLHGGLSLTDALARHEARLTEELAARGRLLRAVQAARAELPLPEFEVRVREQGAQPLLTVSYRTALAHCEGDRHEAHAGLRRRAARLGTAPAGPPFARHPPQGGFNPDDYLVQLCLPVKEAVTGTEPGYGGVIAATRLRGDLTRLLHAYQALSDWLAHTGHQRLGPSAERYLCGLRPGVPPHTEVWAPVSLQNTDP